MSVMLREAHDEIHRDLLEGESSLFCRDAIKGCFCSVSEDLVLLADCTSFDIICYPLTHPYPGQDFCDFSDCFISSWVSSHRVVVE